VGILIVSDYPPTSVINIFSDSQIYCPRHHLFAATLCLSLSLSLSLSVSPLSCSLPTTICSIFNPAMCYHLDHSINTFHEELFSFKGCTYSKIIRIIPVNCKAIQHITFMKVYTSHSSPDEVEEEV
jgi:hypothetical protein